jgi:hypothetical protein
MEPDSPRKKYCTRDENPSCDDDRYFEDLWNKGKHPLQLIEKQLTPKTESDETVT